MTDPLIDLQQYLVSQSYQNVFIDGFKALVPNEETQNYNQINIQSEPSDTGVEVGYRAINWGIYVKNKDQQTARQISMNLRKLLLNNGGKLVAGADTVFWHKIYIVTEPYYWGMTETNEHIYLARYEAFINDTDINTIYN